MSLHFFLKRFLTCLAIVLSHQVTIAQGPFGESVLPDPLKTLESSFYPNLKKGTKSFVYVIDKDTISKSFYDKSGNETVKLEEFRKNKALYRSENKYSNSLKTETAFYVNDILQSKTTYKYVNTNLVEWERIKYNKDARSSAVTTSTDVHWFLNYNKSNKILEAYSVDAANVKNQVYEYSYDSDNKLLLTNELQWQDKYEYQGNFMSKKYRIFKNDGSLYDSVEFKYNDDNLLIEKSDKYYNTRFGYDSKKLKHIHYEKKANSAGLDVELFYAGNQLIKIEMLTKDIKLSPVYPGFIFKSDYLIRSWKLNEQNKLTMEFIYDKNQNVREIKYIINDVYKYSKDFLIEYY